MPRGHCLYPQDTTVDEFLDDGKTPNPQRCPYRTHWDPYVTPAPASRLCCKKTVVKQKLRYDPNNKDIPATHVNFTDERPPRPHLPPNPRGCASQDEVACRKNKRCEYLDEDEEPGLIERCRPRILMPNRNCPPGSRCLPGRCTPKFVKRFDREIPRVCSDKHRCVLPNSVAWKRSGCGEVDDDDDLKNEDVPPGDSSAINQDDDLKHNKDEELSPSSFVPHDFKDELDVKEPLKPPIIKKVTHRRRGCNEFQELNEVEPEPRGWCPVQRCYRHTEAGKRVCRSAPPRPSPSPPPQLFPAPPLPSLPPVYPIEEGDVLDDSFGEYSDSEDEEVELTDSEEEKEEEEEEEEEEVDLQTLDFLGS